MKCRDDVGDHLYLPMPLSFSMSCFIQKIFVTKSQSRQKLEQNVHVFGLPIFWEGRLQIFYWRLLA